MGFVIFILPSFNQTAEPNAIKAICLRFFGKKISVLSVVKLFFRFTPLAVKHALMLAFAATPPDGDAGYQQTTRQADKEKQTNQGPVGFAQFKLDVTGRLGRNGDKGIIVAQPVEDVIAHILVTHVAEERVGQKIAIAHHNDALFRCRLS